MSATTAPERTSSLENTGEHLLLPHDMLDVLTRGNTFARWSRVEAADLIITPLVATPLPPLRGYERPRPAPEVAWHPLAWLPPRLSSLLIVDGQTEDLDSWAVRVALEMEVSGAYDPVSGTWANILSLLGIDKDDTDRLTAWYEGGDDDVLDGFDLDTHLAIPSDPLWSYRQAQAMLPALRKVAWARTARSLGAYAHEVVEESREAQDDPEPEFTDQERAQVVSAMGAIAALTLSEPAEGLGLDFTAATQAVTASDGSDLRDPLGPALTVVDMLAQVERAYAPNEDDLIAAFEKARDEAGLSDEQFGWDSDSSLWPDVVG